MKTRIHCKGLLSGVLCGAALWIGYALGYSQGKQAEQECWFAFATSAESMEFFRDADMLAMRIPGSPPFRGYISGNVAKRGVVSAVNNIPAEPIPAFR
jgi:hypothetical protein